MIKRCKDCGTGKLHLHIIPVNSMTAYLRSLGSFKNVNIGVDL